MQLAFLCPPFTGHLRPMFALGTALRERGHRVGCLCIQDAAPLVSAAGLTPMTLGRDVFPAGALRSLESRIARLRGLLGIRAVIRDTAAMTDMMCREAPAALERMGCDAIVCDQLEAAGGLLAQRFALPHISVANALMLDREPYVPPPFTSWPYARTDWARERNLGGYRVCDWLMTDVSRVIAHWSRVFGLGRRARPDECVSSTQVGQLSPELDFPREDLSKGFRYVGPLRGPLDDGPHWERPVPGPIAFVSLGSLQGGRFALLAKITRACRERGLTPLVAHYGRLSDEEAGALPGEPIVERCVPQRQVIAQSDVVVTHGGLNTVLDTLSLRVPLVLVPLAMEQGAIAQRVLRAGAATRWRPAFGRASLRRAIDKALRDPRQRSAAAAVALSLQAGGGAPAAADLIEHHAG